MKKYVMTVLTVLRILLIPLFSAELFFLILRRVNPDAPVWTDVPFLAHFSATVSVMYVVLTLLISGIRGKNGKAPYTVPILITRLVCLASGLLCVRLGAHFPAGDKSIPAMAVKSIGIASNWVSVFCTFLYIPFALTGAVPTPSPAINEPDGGIESGEDNADVQEKDL